MKIRTLLRPLVLVLLGVVMAMGSACAEEAWKTTLNRQLPLMGHRNWIVIADAAYPWQAAPGIETIATGADHLTVVKAVLDAVSKSKSVRPIVQTDSELQYISEKDAPAIPAFRDELKKLMGTTTSQSLPHNQLINTIAQDGQTFRVLLLKTKGTLPYSSVFIQLDAAYWTPEAEQRLRAAMPAAPPVFAVSNGAPNAGAPGFRPRDGGPPRPRGRRGGG